LKASSSAYGGCVEVAPTTEGVVVRNSRRPDAEHIVYTKHEWACFLDGAKKGEFDHLAE